MRRFVIHGRFAEEPMAAAEHAAAARLLARLVAQAIVADILPCAAADATAQPPASRDDCLGQRSGEEGR